MASTLELSPSLVDAYEFWLDAESGSDWEARAYADLVASIKREKRPPTEAMALGIAWHQALEAPTRPVLDVVSVTLESGAEYRFSGDAVRAAMDARPHRTLPEMWGDLECRSATLRLRVDGVSGNEIHEVKSTAKEPDPERYMRTLQWRAYLLAFEASVVVYHVCRLGYNKEIEAYALDDMTRFTQYPYPGMREDVEGRVAALAEFIRDEGLAEYRERRERRKS